MQQKNKSKKFKMSQTGFVIFILQNFHLLSIISFNLQKLNNVGKNHLDQELGFEIWDLFLGNLKKRHI